MKKREGFLEVVEGMAGNVPVLCSQGIELMG